MQLLIEPKNVVEVAKPSLRDPGPEWVRTRGQREPTAERSERGPVHEGTTAAGRHSGHQSLLQQLSQDVEEFSSAVTLTSCMTQSEARRGTRRLPWRRGVSLRNDASLSDAGVVYRELAPAVLGFLRSERARDPEDVLGEVFLQVAHDLPRFRGDRDSLRRWVFTIARHRLVDEHRRRSRRPQLFDGELPDIAAPPPAEALDPELVDALALLTDDQREVIVLRFVADLSIDDVARITKRKIGAVKAFSTVHFLHLGRILTDSLAAYTGNDEPSA